jgi:aspartate/tyrosine/aromatic aminotransferase
MPKNSVIILHAGCHNPTGVDPTHEQWKELSKLIKKRQLIPFFDMAYQGFDKSLTEDPFAITLFLQEGHEMLIANSFSKNLGLYGERVGGLILIAKDLKSKTHCMSHLKQIVRANYSSPPMHGMQIVKEILLNEELRSGWEEELGDMRLRLQEMRHNLLSALQDRDPTHDYSFMKPQKGFFSFLGLSKKQVASLLSDYAIYMPTSGRINVAGINGHNFNYIVDAIIAVKKI